MDVTSFLLAEWVLWVRGAMLATLGYFLCRRRNYAAVAVALLAAYWAYSSLSFTIEFRSEVVRQVGVGYIVQACLALLLPFALMAFGLFRGRKKGAELGAAPNGGSAAPSGRSGVVEGPPSVS
jgi:hypothetical protein